MRTALNLLDYTPTEVRQYAQNTYRTIADTMMAMKQTIEDPAVRQQVGAKPLPPLVDKVFASAAFQTRLPRSSGIPAVEHSIANAPSRGTQSTTSWSEMAWNTVRSS